jgi:mRNA interferase RelE/StbE
MIWMYSILLHPLAAKSFEKLDKEIRRQVRNKLKELEEFPEQRGKHLKYTQFWSLRIGDYRAIYEIKSKKKKVIILFIGHRDDVYDDFSKLF